MTVFARHHGRAAYDDASSWRCSKLIHLMAHPAKTNCLRPAMTSRYSLEMTSRYSLETTSRYSLEMTSRYSLPYLLGVGVDLVWRLVPQTLVCVAPQDGVLQLGYHPASSPMER
jgi:hypothetical protein